MCGRFTLRTPAHQLALHFNLTQFEGMDLEPRFNIAPSQPVVAVRVAQGASATELVQLRWGLVPSWADDASIGNRLINARSESAAEKPAFRQAFARRRCLIPTDGFFEWQAHAGKRQPYFISRRDGQPYAMAGLWERWTDRGGVVLESCTILTTEANEALQPLHHRMPVILPQAAYARWLQPERSATELAALMRPLADNDALAYRPVSTCVNRPACDGPECIEPVALEPESKAPVETRQKELF